MWQETKHGLYKQFIFRNFTEAWAFIQRVAISIGDADRHLRWQNESNVVDVWLAGQERGISIDEHDRELSQVIDRLVNERPGQSLDAADVNIASFTTEVQLYADGGSRGNPGPSASGYVLLDMNEKVIFRHGEYVGVTTNNQAEYQALRLGLECALHNFHAHEVHVYMDSMLVVNQMKNIFKIKNRDLWPVHNACLDLTKKFNKVTFDHVPRELNKLADAEVNNALDDVLKKAE